MDVLGKYYNKSGPQNKVRLRCFFSLAATKLTQVSDWAKASCQLLRFISRRKLTLKGQEGGEEKRPGGGGWSGRGLKREEKKFCFWCLQNLAMELKGEKKAVFVILCVTC